MDSTERQKKQKKKQKNKHHKRNQMANLLETSSDVVQDVLLFAAVLLPQCQKVELQGPGKKCEKAKFEDHGQFLRLGQI